MHDGLDAAIAMFSLFGGTSLIIWTSMKAKIARIKAEAEAGRITAGQGPTDAVLTEMKAMRRQMEQMQSTSHEFDISFDKALSRLEERVSRVEAKAAAAPAAASAPEDVQRIGLR